MHCHALGFLAVGLVVWGCASGCGRRSAENQAPGVVTLHVSDWGGVSVDPNTERFQNEVTAEWTRRHPNIRIVEEHIPSDYVPKMLTEFVAGVEPDVMMLDDASAAVFINNNTLRDLMPMVRTDKLDLSVYYPNVLAVAQRGDHLYALPGDFTPLMVYYNKRMFRQAGVPFPKDGWTWQDFETDCRRLTVWPRGAPHPTQYGFFLENWMPAWITWIKQHGGAVLSPDGSHASGYLDSPATTQAVQFIADMVQNHLAPTLSQNQAQGADPFQSKLVAMQESGHWNLVGLKASETIQMQDVGVVGLPRDKKRITMLYESGASITKGCKHVPEAWEYIKFLTGPFVQEKKAELGIGMAANRHVAEARRNSGPYEPEFLDNIPYGIAPRGTQDENYAQIEDICTEMMEGILVGGQPVPQALHETARRIDAEIASE